MIGTRSFFRPFSPATKHDVKPETVWIINIRWGRTEGPVSPGGGQYDSHLIGTVERLSKTDAAKQSILHVFCINIGIRKGSQRENLPAEHTKGPLKRLLNFKGLYF